LFLRVALALITVAIVGLLVRSGMHQIGAAGQGGGDQLISDEAIVTLIPIGAVLIIAHTLLHMVIDLDYLARGKTPPERARSAH
jgi:hypothetical protein